MNKDEREAMLFERGWRAAADWAGRDDLIADIDSPAYIAEVVAARASAPAANPECGNTPYDEGPFTLATPDARPADDTTRLDFIQSLTDEDVRATIDAARSLPVAQGEGK